METNLELLFSKSVINISYWHVICTVFVLWFLHKLIEGITSELPPGPIGFPIIGIIPYADQNIEKTFEKWSKTYGPVLCAQIGWSNTVVLNNYDAIHQAFVVQSHQFINRPSSFFNNFVSLNGHGVIFTKGDERWKMQRKFIQRSLTGNLEHRILQEAECLCNTFKSLNGKATNLKHIIGSVAFNVIRRMTIHEQYEPEEMDNFCYDVLNVVQKHGIYFYVLSIAPWMRFFPPVRALWKDLLMQIKTSSDMLYNTIDSHGTTLNPNHPRDFIDLFVIEMNKRNPMFTRTQLRVLLVDLFGAGTDTSTTTLRWIFRYLICYPEMQERMYKEINSLIGSDGTVRADCNLPFTRAFIEETFRVRPVAPLGIPHCTTEDVDFMGYVIPKNTQVFANIWAANRDPEIWEKPFTFDPERFLDSDGVFQKTSKSLTFLIGPRNCLGEKIARMEIFIVLVSVLQRFRVCPNPDQPLPCMEGQPGLSVGPKEYLIVLNER